MSNFKLFAMKTRVYFLDNLRTFLIFLVIVLHAGIVYEPILENIWIVSDPVKQSSIGLIRMYLDLFIMFTMFFISGYFIPWSLKRNNTWGFIRSKFTRIILPWIIAVLTLIPAYKVLFLYSRGMPQEAWYTYFHIFERNAGVFGSFADNPMQSWLWFLPLLFLFQIVYLALSRTNLLSIKLSLRTAVVLTFVIGLIYSMVISNTGLTGWHHSPLLHFQRERLLVYFMVFLLGSLCNKLDVFNPEKTLNKRYYIVSNVVLTLSLSVFTVVALNLFYNMIDPERNYYFVSLFVDRGLYYGFMLLSMLSFLHIFIYTFQVKFNKTNRLMSQLNRGSYAVYIIHLLVVGVFALILLNISMPVMVKYLILTILSFVVSNALVYIYYRLFQHRFIYKIAAAVIFIVAFYSITSPGSNEMSSMGKDDMPVLQEEVPAPGVGLHMAIIQGDMEVVRQHIQAGSDLDLKEPKGGSSPLITAAVFGRTDAALALIEAGADVNIKNNDGSTPLHTAAFFCRTEIVEALLANGADVSIKNNAGSTALVSVAGSFEEVKDIYEYFGNALAPLGLELDYEKIKLTRPQIAELLQNNAVE